MHRRLPPRSARSGRIRLGLLLLLTLLLVVFLVEGVLRVIQFTGGKTEELKPSFVAVQETSRSMGHPYLAYAPKPGWSREPGPKEGQKSHNSGGFRGAERSVEKPEGTFRIVTLGGSSTYGTTPSSDEATWPHRLEVRLNAAEELVPVEVLNFGYMGYSTYESLIRLSLQAIDYRPDLVIVYHTINDARFALWQPGGPVQRDNTHLRTVWPLYDLSPGEELLEKSYGYLLWRANFTDYLSRFETLDIYAMRGFDPDDPDPYAREQPDPLGFQSIQRNLISIGAVAKAHGARVMFVSQGCDRDDIKAKSRHQQFQAMDFIGGLLQSVAKERGHLFFDARTPMEAAWEPIKAECDQLQKAGKHAEFAEKAIFTGEVHLTDRGADMLADLIAGKLASDGIVPRR